MSLPRKVAPSHDEVAISKQAAQPAGPDPALWIEVKSKMVISRSL